MRVDEEDIGPCYDGGYALPSHVAAIRDRLRVRGAGLDQRAAAWLSVASVMLVVGCWLLSLMFACLRFGRKSG